MRELWWCVKGAAAAIGGMVSQNTSMTIKVLYPHSTQLYMQKLTLMLSVLCNTNRQ